MKSETLNFRQLIEKLGRISIPMLQRDYAQGRDSAEGVRKLFLDALFAALDDNAKSITLDFIYGNTVDGVFSPLDGQQRLTTLFLLHWYLAVCDGQCEDWKGWMTQGDNSMFTYEVRPSSRDFFNQLTRYAPKPFSELPSVQIKDQIWFMFTWLNDPTILSALKMLDAMYRRFSKTLGRYHKLVSDSAPITFHWLDIGAYPDADDLYVKMNARGKPLTVFESFKALLEERIGELFLDQAFLPKSEECSFKSYFSRQMDGVWLDLFWHYSSKREKPEVPDAMIMRFVREVAVLAVAVNDAETNQNDLAALRSKSSTLNFLDDKKQKSVSKTFVQLFAVLLQNWSGKADGIKTFLPADNPFKETVIFTDIIEKDGSLSYSRSVMLYGYAVYLEKHRGSEIDSQRFGEWMRIVYNLAENTSYGDANKFRNCLKKLQVLVEKADHILESLDSGDVVLAGSFEDYQVKEEQLKARLMLRNPDWRQSIAEAEAHGYFSGQIGFLFRFSGIAEAGPEADMHLADFKMWWNKSAHCFSDEGVKLTDFLWERALLATGDYLLAEGTHLLENARSADYNWKRLLRGEEGDVQQAEIQKMLIRRVSHELPLVDQLEVICKEATGQPNIEEWRKLIVQWPEIIGFCGKRRIRREDNGRLIYLLQRTDYKGRWAEVWSYALHLKLKEDIANYGPFQEVGYHMARGDDSCAWLLWKAKKEHYGHMALNVERGRKGEGAKLTFLRWYSKPIDPTVVEVIEKKGFQAKDGRYELTIDDKERALEVIKEVAKTLRCFQDEDCAGE